MNSALYVTLGHNSSAVFANERVVVAGYEEERLNRKKSSSAYPRQAIELAAPNGADVAFVSHWFDDLTLASNKYLDFDHLSNYAPEIVSLSPSFTHHDAHAASACGFYQSNGGRCESADVIVLDGFGTFQETLSVYHARWPLSMPKLTHRTYGYATSLGLMYQYTTEFLGMRPNQDEYKLLGYEAHITEYMSRVEIAGLVSVISDQAYAHARTMLDATDRKEWTGGLINFGELTDAKAYWTRVAAGWLDLCRPAKTVYTAKAIKTCVAFCAQTFLEHCMLCLVDRLLPPARNAPSDLILVGGCFYNVKLNRRLQVKTGRRVFAHPLSGDQGAALGHSPEVNQSGLTWGIRTIGKRTALPPGVSVFRDESWVAAVAGLLDRGRIVNLVRGAMEFGPRALCNTTTLALPTKRNVERINALNERDDAMPMAPVITRGRALDLFKHSEVLDIPISDRFMITTVAFDGEPPERLQGVAHVDPVSELWTARPQIVDSGQIDQLLRMMPDQCLINTSFNYHGEPIVYSEDDACKTHEMQSFRAQTLDMEPPVTVLVIS